MLGGRRRKVLIKPRSSKSGNQLQIEGSFVVNNDIVIAFIVSCSHHID